MTVNPAHFNPLDCNEVSESCPVQASIDGYYPNLEYDIFFTVYFGLFFLANLYLGWRFRTWTYQIAMCFACISSCIGYIGRDIMHNNPFNGTGFKIQISCLIFAPAFNSAALYLILKHLVIQLGRDWSRIRPKFYTWAFITADCFALSLQAAGGGIAASAGNDNSFRAVGDNLLITGISWQVLTLLIFALATADYTIRRFRSSEPWTPTAHALLQDRKFHIFVVAQSAAFLGIFVRCVYRTAEMSGGWRNPIMQNQGLFIGLEGVMIGAATLLQTLVHPGYFFPALTTYRESKKMERFSSQIRGNETSIEKSAV